MKILLSSSRLGMAAGIRCGDPWLYAVSLATTRPIMQGICC